MLVLIDGIRYVPETQSEEQLRTQLETANRRLKAVDKGLNWVGEGCGGTGYKTVKFGPLRESGNSSPILNCCRTKTTGVSSKRVRA